MLSALLPITVLLGHTLAVTQPLNTPIIGQYGYSPAVLPSRMCRMFSSSTFILTVDSQYYWYWMGGSTGKSKSFRSPINSRGEGTDDYWPPGTMCREHCSDTTIRLSRLVPTGKGHQNSVLPMCSF